MAELSTRFPSNAEGMTAPLESDLRSLQPRFADVWIVPGAMIALAVLSGKPGFSTGRWSRWLRRAVFVGGVYIIYRNYDVYKRTIAMIGGKGEEP